jgi:tetratricopeptide (TPR) repeat protein
MWSFYAIGVCVAQTSNSPAGSPRSDAAVHKMRGVFLFSQGNYSDAEQELQLASQLDPTDSDTLLQLGVTFQNERRLHEALTAYSQALQRNPRTQYIPLLHAQIGFVQASLGDRDRAYKELLESERLEAPENVFTEQMLFEGYLRLHKTEAAIRHGEIFLSLAKQTGTRPDVVPEVESFLRSTKLKNTPVYFTNQPPAEYDQPAFDATLQSRLSSGDVNLIVNPLSSSQPMRMWGRRLVGDVSGDAQKAQILLDVIGQRTFGEPRDISRTAIEVFAEWDNPKVSYVCQDLTFFYVALARAVGLKAFCADVEQEWDGTWDHHMCAAVFIGGRALLVDPGLNWFGVPHKRYRILNDVQAAAIYASGYSDPKHLQVACSLAPELPDAHVALFDWLTYQNRWTEARAEADQLARIRPEGPDTYYAQGVLAVSTGEWGRASRLLSKAMELAPNDDSIPFQLGEMLTMQGKLNEAREAYHVALRVALTQFGLERAREAIRRLDQPDARYYFGRACAQQFEANWDGAITNYQKAIDLEPAYAEAYYGRGCVRQAEGNLGGALADYTKAVELKPDYAVAYDNRGAIESLKGDLDRALADHSRAVQIEPHLAPAYFNRGGVEQAKGFLDAAFGDFNRAYELNPDLATNLAAAFSNLGCAYYDRGQCQEAVRSLQRSCDLNPTEYRTHLRLWLAKAHLGQTSAADTELRAFVSEHNGQGTTDWQCAIANFLEGELPETEFLNRAKKSNSGIPNDRVCDGWFYAGSKRELAGDRAIALKYLQNCVASGKSNSPEAASARAELRRMGK